MKTSASSIQAKPLSAGERKDLKVLALFTAVWCRAQHGGEKRPLDTESVGMTEAGVEKYRYCPQCREFLAYAMIRRVKCPLEPKPTCKHCQVHCYRPGHREQVRQIMRFSGKHLILRGRLDLLWHYFF
ncbi:MAG: nitrous oxide-stimulated promoter family protein [Desulfuromonadales bacterium]|nr:nitrous oxide-stimulated promoter family protein [Desulfuromonadales bacterium]